MLAKSGFGHPGSGEEVLGSGIDGIVDNEFSTDDSNTISSENRCSSFRIPFVS
jgi:hypothetical protein